MAIVIKLSYALFLAVVEKLQYNKALVSDVFFCADPVLGIQKSLQLILRVSSQIVITNNDQ